MAFLQELKGPDIAGILGIAAAEGLAVSLTFHLQNRWVSARSRLVALAQGALFMEIPKAPGAGQAPTLPPGTEVGITFWRGPSKYHLSSSISQTCSVDRKGQKTPAVSVPVPTVIRQSNRRSSQRVDVPGDKTVRAIFWLGGLESEPEPNSPHTPVWSGRLIDLSSEGFQVRAGGGTSADMFDVGDVFGARLIFSDANVTLRTDCMLRHKQLDGEMALMGFKFLELQSANDGVNAMDWVCTKVEEYRQAAK